RSTDLRSAYAQVKAAEAQSRVALSGALPTLTGQGFLTYNFLTKDIPTVTGFNPTTGALTSTTIESPTRGPFVNGTLTAAMPLTPPRTWYSVGTAHRAEDVARASVEDIKRQIALNVATTIISVVTTERVAEINRIGFRSALERLELTQRKKALGAATGL